MVKLVLYDLQVALFSEIQISLTLMRHNNFRLPRGTRAFLSGISIITAFTGPNNAHAVFLAVQAKERSWIWRKC
jgi:hypothetical protein